MNTMLLVIAHPDDESFYVGGTVARYAREGWDIHVIAVTSGERGSSGEYGDVKKEALTLIRQDELRAAASVLGINHVTFLDFPDGELKDSTPGLIEEQVNRIMRKILPDIVITHDTTGINNHPDHIRVSFATTYAFQKYAAYLAGYQDPADLTRGRGKLWKLAEHERLFGETGAFSTEPKLYYTCLPESSVRYLRREKQIQEESHGKPWMGTPDKYITTIIDIKPTQLVKGKALLCHKSQMEEVDRFISFARNPSVEREYFILRMQGVHEVFMGKEDRVADVL